MILAEAIFDGLYLLALGICAVLLLRGGPAGPAWKKTPTSREKPSAAWDPAKAGRSAAGVLPAAAGLTLLLTAAVHLLPRLLRAVPGLEPRYWLGLGDLAAAVGLTVWCLLLYYIWERVFRTDVRDRLVFWMVWGFAVLRLLLCALPGNGWFRGGGSPLWTTLRSLPLAGLTGALVLLYRMTRSLNRRLRPVWLLQLLGFVCLLPAVPGGVGFAVPLMAGHALCQLGTGICLIRFQKNR